MEFWKFCFIKSEYFVKCFRWESWDPKGSWFWLLNVFWSYFLNPNWPFYWWIDVFIHKIYDIFEVIWPIWHFHYSSDLSIAAIYFFYCRWLSFSVINRTLEDRFDEKVKMSIKADVGDGSWRRIELITSVIFWK